jgi:hypothetical protein
MQVTAAEFTAAVEAFEPHAPAERLPPDAPAAARPAMADRAGASFGGQCVVFVHRGLIQVCARVRVRCLYQRSVPSVVALTI